MLTFIAKLFAAETTRTAPTTKAILGLSAMEDRYAPAALSSSINWIQVPDSSAVILVGAQDDILGGDDEMINGCDLL